MKRLFLTAVAAAVILAVGTVRAQEGQEAAESAAVAKEAYDYTASKNRDPFLSIIEASKRRNELEREKKKRKGLAPLEDYDLSQFNLIAIVWDNTQYYAMIGLPDGKFYTLRTGMNVGIHGGTVTDITKNAVEIREYLPDYKGEIKPQHTVLRLRKEEGE